MTSGQENALESAQSYVDMSGFSKANLIQQLSSSAGEGYSKADATFAANNVDANWDKEAVESAQSNLDKDVLPVHPVHVATRMRRTAAASSETGTASGWRRARCASRRCDSDAGSGVRSASRHQHLPVGGR